QRFERLGEAHPRKRFAYLGKRDQRRTRLFVEHGFLGFKDVRKLARPRDRVLADRDVALPRGARFRDLLLQQPALQRRREPARGLYFLKEFPRGLAEFGGQRLNAARTRRGIADPEQVRFFEQYRLRIARDPPRKSVRQTER